VFYLNYINKVRLGLNWNNKIFYILVNDLEDHLVYFWRMNSEEATVRRVNEDPPFVYLCYYSSECHTSAPFIPSQYQLHIMRPKL